MKIILKPLIIYHHFVFDFIVYHFQLCFKACVTVQKKLTACRWENLYLISYNRCFFKRCKFHCIYKLKEMFRSFEIHLTTRISQEHFLFICQCNAVQPDISLLFFIFFSLFLGFLNISSILNLWTFRKKRLNCDFTGFPTISMRTSVFFYFVVHITHCLCWCKGELICTTYCVVKVSGVSLWRRRVMWRLSWSGWTLNSWRFTSWNSKVSISKCSESHTLHTTFPFDRTSFMNEYPRVICGTLPIGGSDMLKCSGQFFFHNHVDTVGDRIIHINWIVDKTKYTLNLAICVSNYIHQRIIDIP